VTRTVLFALIAVAGAASPALAHTGHGAASGFMAGVAHPLGGLDHLLAMIAVGILAAQIGGRALWLVPASFVGMILVGAMLGFAGTPLPLVEIGIVGSVVVLGLVIAAGRRMPMGAAMALVGVMALFHGHAHGTEMPVSASGLAYGAGFTLATLGLHAAGIGLCVAVREAVSRNADVVLRAGGGVIAGVGALLFAS
jgi:urease accessory protein